MADKDCFNVDDDLSDKDDRRKRSERGRFEERSNFDVRGGRQGQAFGVEELSSKLLQIQAKKFYLDVKQNKRGRFVKISEVGANGHKNRIIFDMTTASDFHEMLTNFIEEYSALGPRNTVPGDDKIKSEVIFAGERRYYMDLKENSRGRFLKVAMTMPPPSMERQQIVIPAQGMIDIRDALTDILSEFGGSISADKMAEESVDEKMSLESENKVFCFDIGENKRGDYLRISEVSPSFRTAINIPQQLWPDFIAKLHSMSDTLLSKDSKTPAADGDSDMKETISSAVKDDKDSYAGDYVF